MRVAIIHDVLIELGGAERTLHTLLEMYPHADVYCPLITSQNIKTVSNLTTGRVFTSIFNRAPLAHRAASVLKPFIYLYWELLDLSGYDLVISSSHSFSSKSVITSPFTKHIAYIYTPPRFLYAEFNEMHFLKHEPWKTLCSPLLSSMRVLDYVGAQRPDVLVAISKDIQRRIQKYYKRTSTIIHPPVTISDKYIKNWRMGTYYLCVSRLVKQKGIRLAIEACNRHKLPLHIVGVGQQMGALKRLAGPTISFLGHISDAQMHKEYAHAKALLYCSVEEDFGLVPVEANSCGVPVVAFLSGGVRETIISNKTGIFFSTYTPESLFSAILELNDSHITSAACHVQASKFAKKNFTVKFKNVVNT